MLSTNRLVQHISGRVSNTAAELLQRAAVCAQRCIQFGGSRRASSRTGKLSYTLHRLGIQPCWARISAHSLLLQACAVLSRWHRSSQGRREELLHIRTLIAGVPGAPSWPFTCVREECGSAARPKRTSWRAPRPHAPEQAADCRHATCDRMLERRLDSCRPYIGLEKAACLTSGDCAFCDELKKFKATMESALLEISTMAAHRSVCSDYEWWFSLPRTCRALSFVLR